MGAQLAYLPCLSSRTHYDYGVSQKLSPVRVHGPMPKLTLYAFLDPRSNKLSTVNANWTKNYPEVDNRLFPNCEHHCDSSLLADI